MAKKEDIITQLIDETKERLKDEKMVGLVAGAIVGYMLRDKLENNSELRNTILGAVGGETVARLLGDGRTSDDGK